MNSDTFAARIVIPPHLRDQERKGFIQHAKVKMITKLANKIAGLGDHFEVEIKFDYHWLDKEEFDYRWPAREGVEVIDVSAQITWEASA